MTKQEIDNMMRELPSQQQWYYERSRRYIINEALAGLAFVLCVGILCFI
jgi:hypothetical protein